jgi:hypothetical protein
MAFSRMNWNNQLCTLNLWAGATARVRTAGCPTRARLAGAFNRLENIEVMRWRRKDPFIDKSAEERIIWCELLELELQAVDEQSERILAAAGERSGQ